jgi:uncharacterized protein (DUF1330 family)
MKTAIAIAISLLVGFGMGALTIDNLHAQAKAPVYVIIETDVSNVEAYTKEFAPKAQALSKKSGVRLLAASLNVKTMEGQPPKRIALQQWDSMEQVTAWYASPEYKEVRKIGDKYAKFRIFAVEGLSQK